MEPIPIANRTSRKPNALLDAAERARALVDLTTPEPTPVDPELFNPVQRNPQPVADAITSLAQARTEGNVAANELARQNFNRQINQLILQQVLGLSGAIGNLGGGQTQTGINQRVDQSLATALGLQDQLTQQQIQSAQQIPLIQAQAELDRAKLEEDTRVSNEEAQRQARIQTTELIMAAEDRARQQGIDIRTALQQEIANRQTDEQIGIAETNAASGMITAQAALNRSLLDARRGSGSDDKSPAGVSRKLLQDYRGSRARAEAAQSQLGSMADPMTDDPTSAFTQMAGEGVASEMFEQQQIAQANLMQFSGSLRTLPTNDVQSFLEEGLETGDADILMPVLDELRIRSTRNDPEIRRMEAEANEGVPPGQAVSMNDIINNIEADIRAGRIGRQ